ncbi:tyrosine-type recombinase/integrase [Streptomyces sp. NPDC018955]|uniref:tyrosine-type recombinase/integrase n=1 Tax=Streptomyces sp. NPDC018955 TaxID=3365055 RepID=UPI0037920612
MGRCPGSRIPAHEAIPFLRATRAHRLSAACVLVLVPGLRRGELLGPRWQDVGFEVRQFTPVKQVQRVRGTGLVLKDLTAEPSQTVFPLPEFRARALEERRERRGLERKAAGDHWSLEPNQDLLFSSEHGGVIDPSGFSRTFDRLVKRAGVRRTTVRLARHTCGILLAFLKVHPKVAQAISGTVGSAWPWTSARTWRATASGRL